MKSNPLNLRIEEAARIAGLHVGVSITAMAPAFKDLVRNKIMPLYVALEGTPHFEKCVAFLEAIGCAPEPRIIDVSLADLLTAAEIEHERLRDEHEKLESSG